MGQAGVVDVTNGEFDSGVGSVVGVGGFGVEVVSVGDERVVAPVRPQLALGADKAAASDDQAQRAGALEISAADVDSGLSDLSDTSPRQRSGAPSALLRLSGAEPT